MNSQHSKHIDLDFEREKTTVHYLSDVVLTAIMIFTIMITVNSIHDVDDDHETDFYGLLMVNSLRI